MVQSRSGAWYALLLCICTSCVVCASTAEGGGTDSALQTLLESERGCVFTHPACVVVLAQGVKGRRQEGKPLSLKDGGRAGAAGTAAEATVMQQCEAFTAGCRAALQQQTGRAGWLVSPQ